MLVGYPLVLNALHNFIIYIIDNPYWTILQRKNFGEIKRISAHLVYIYFSTLMYVQKTTCLKISTTVINSKRLFLSTW